MLNSANQGSYHFHSEVIAATTAETFIHGHQIGSICKCEAGLGSSLLFACIFTLLLT